ncbi:DUF2336 domain-containing protein [Sneathiella sp.]|uniref:DUF2336 domain-containing protein n=1 Tax=Sneathiella sp. TaxID=1964365 RepID=UPI0026084620|nr:DUF2336 domain-containing protein [Sneathiella sp.]MDF2366591.1 DUF2336 domain-containing protein [Sneathiella sp.]
MSGQSNLEKTASPTYEDNKARALSADVTIRADLAAYEEAEPEILYYLTDDSSDKVRKNLALNPCTPVKANLILAQDEDEEVRMDLARKICRLLPDLSGEQTAIILEKTIEVLEILARDQVTAVRAIISDTLKENVGAPKNIIMDLARDVEEIVASPILEYSPLLSDNDLLEIMASGIAAGALPAVARRPGLSEDVSGAVVAQLEVPAISTLLANPSAKIREETLDQIMDQAESVESLHEPLVMRINLSLRAMRRISGFVASSLVEKLVRRNNLPPATEKELKNIVRGRIEETREFTPKEEGGSVRAENLFAESTLDEDAIADAVDLKDQEFVVTALSLLSKYSAKKINTMMASRNGKVVTSLCWKAGLSMRLAFKIQTVIAHVPRGDIVNARNGIEYPFTDKEMDWQLSFYEG